MPTAISSQKSLGHREMGRAIAVAALLCALSACGASSHATTGSRPVRTIFPPNTQSAPITTPPTAGSPPIPSPPAAESACEASFSNAIARNLAYQPARQMKVGQSASVMVVLGTPNVQLPLITGSPTTVIRIATTCEVEAQLTAAPGAFDIAPSQFQIQSFIDGPVLTWTWGVTPEQVGTSLDLDLEIDSLYQQSDGQPLPGRVRSYTAVISVSATSAQLTHRAGSILDNPLFDTFLAAILPLVVGGLWSRRWWRRRQTPDSPPGPDPPDSDGVTIDLVSGHLVSGPPETAEPEVTAREERQDR